MNRERASLCGHIPLKTRHLSPPPSALGRGGNEEGHTCSLKGSASQRKPIASACVSWAGTQNSARDHIPLQGRKDQGGSEKGNLGDQAAAKSNPILRDVSMAHCTWLEVHRLPFIHLINIYLAPDCVQALCEGDQQYLSDSDTISVLNELTA